MSPDDFSQEQADVIRRRILSKVRREGECMLWEACVSTTGSAMIRAFGRAYIVPRLCKVLLGGVPLRANERLKRRCASEFCVNPDHWAVRPIKARPGNE